MCRTNSAGEVLMEHEVAAGDIWRACQTKDAPGPDQCSRSPARGPRRPRVLARPRARPRDLTLIEKVKTYLAEHDTEGLDIRIMSPVEGREVLRRPHPPRRGHHLGDGNVLRDYNTDLFLILELGTSAKMLSAVPLMNGGGPSRPAPGAPRRSTCSSSSPRTTRAFGQPRRVPGAGREPAAHGRHYRQPALGGVFADTLDRFDERLLNENRSPASARWGRSTTAAATTTSPLLGQRAGAAERGCRAGRGVRADCRVPGEQRGHDHGRADRCAGPPGRHRRLLLPRRRQGLSGSCGRRRRSTRRWRSCSEA